MNNDKQNRSSRRGMNGKGYYIALTLCAVAIGISGYMYYRNVNQTGEVSSPTVSQTGHKGAGSRPVEVLGTEPQGTTGATTPTTGATEPTQSAGPKTVSWPLEGDTVSAYAMEALAYNETTRDWRIHDGIDLSGEVGAQVRSAAEGTVYTVYEDDAMGVTVVIRHSGGYATTYSSLSQDVRVKAGDAVKCGQVIGAIGETALVENAEGPHVHFAVSCNGVSVDPIQFLPD